MCLGYDNYGMLLNSSDSNRSRFRDHSATTTTTTTTRHFNRRQFYRQQNASRNQLDRHQNHQKHNNNRHENSNLHHQHFYHPNQYGLDDRLLSIEYERARKEKLASSRTTKEDHDHQKEEQTETVVIDPDLLRVKNDEENRMCNDTFKAQMIKSLTFKNVVTY